MNFAKLITNLADRGLRIVRRPHDRLECQGEQSQLTDELRQSLKEHRDAFLSLLEPPEAVCQRLVENAIDTSNSLCPPCWTPTETAWEAMDEFEEHLYDAARAGDVEWTKAAADEYVRCCETVFLADRLQDWPAESLDEVESDG